MKVIGFKRYEFTNQYGNIKSGHTITVSEDRNGYTGIWAKTESLSDEKMRGYVPQIGDEVEFFYNDRQKVCGIDLISSYDDEVPFEDAV